MEIVWVYNHFRQPVNGLCRRALPPCASLLKEAGPGDIPVSLTEETVIDVECGPEGCQAVAHKPDCDDSQQLLWFSLSGTGEAEYSIHSFTEQELADVETVRRGRFEALGTPYSHGDRLGAPKCDTNGCVRPSNSLIYETTIDPEDYATEENLLETVRASQFTNLHAVRQIL